VFESLPPFSSFPDAKTPAFSRWQFAGRGVTNGVIEVTQFMRCALFVPANAGHGYIGKVGVCQCSSDRCALA
jgi:hypothetical protein